MTSGRGEHGEHGERVDLDRERERLERGLAGGGAGMTSGRGEHGERIELDREGVERGLAGGGAGMTSGRGEHGERVELDREGVERGLAGLVLTVVELLRQLIERQALRRVDVGDLSDEQIERIGLTLMALDERMNELCEHFGLAPQDLNLDLGPLGPLLPRDR